MVQAAQAQHDSLMKTHARLGSLKSLTYQGPGPGGGDTYLGVFAYNSRNISIGVDAGGKVNSFFFGPVLPQNEEQLKASFKAIDLNSDGKADETEYKTMLEKIGLPQLFDSLFTQIDEDKDGLITAKEYEANPQQ
jgi:hypothetical protein